jgi:TPR repeat protein
VCTGALATLAGRDFARTASELQLTHSIQKSNGGIPMIRSIPSTRFTIPLSLMLFAAPLWGCAGTTTSALADHDTQACVEHALRHDPDQRSLPIAIEQFSSECRKKVAAACSVLGVMYEFGQGVVRDERRAARLYQTACDEGNVRGCANLAGAMVKGTGMPASPQNAIGLLRRSCMQKAIGCALLGRLTAKGEGTVADPVMAASLFERGCMNGEAESCRELGDALKGAGQPSDQRAMELYINACVAGDREACDRVSSPPEPRIAPGPATTLATAR